MARVELSFRKWRGNSCINWGDVLRKNVVNNVDMSSLRAPWQKRPYKTNTQNNTTARQHHDATDIQKKWGIPFEGW